jgi:hypothetical protein
MKNERTFVKKLLLNAALAASLALPILAMADAIKLDDVKVGSTITREGIDLGGVFSHDYLPVPDGEWTVLRITDYIERFGRTGMEKDFRYVKLVLANNDVNASVRFIGVDFNPVVERISTPFRPCSFAWNDDFGSTNSQFLYRCGVYC